MAGLCYYNRMMDFDSVMATLPSDEERTKMVALPYRIGLYVSHADTTGGWEAQETEMQSLNTILRSFTEDFCKSEFVQGLLLQTLSRRAEWTDWSHHLDSVPAECVAAIYDLRGAMDAKHVGAFQDMMMDISFAVAQAFRENREAGAIREPGLIARMLGRVRGPSRLDHMNISQTERTALQQLADALDFNM